MIFVIFYLVPAILCVLGFLPFVIEELNDKTIIGASEIPILALLPIVNILSCFVLFIFWCYFIFSRKHI